MKIDDKFMSLEFKVKNKKHSLSLQRGEDVIATIDKFLKINRIRLNNLKGLKIIEEEGDGMISQRIAQTIIKIFKFAAS